MDETRFIKICMVLLLFAWIYRDASAQNIPPPDEPVLESVSVNPQTGLVTITWYPKSPPVSSTSTDGYVIYWLQTKPSSANHPIDTVWNPGARSYTFDPAIVSPALPMPDPRKTTVPFTVATVHRKPLSTSTRTNEDYNVQVVNAYDSCRAEIKLSWHPYKGWYQNREPYKPLISYRIMQIPAGGGVPQEVKILSDQDTSYVITRIEENKQYTFYIEAERSDGLKVTGYKTEKFTRMPLAPTFVEVDGTQYNAQGLAEISFKIDPAAQTYSYEFLGSSKPDYSFVSLGTFNIHSDTVLTDIQSRGKTFYYKLSAWHVCKTRYTAESNVATALWLYLKQDDQLNTLQWDAYKDWSGPAKYEVHRQVGSNAEEVIATITDPDATLYKDDMSGVQIDGDVCYWITAVPVSPTSPDQHAVSNSICIKPESEVFIPQAFTPNGDGNNDVYKLAFSYPPQEFLLIVYDRTGAKVFQTKDINDGWDGRLKNGKPANEGVYSYYIKFRTAKGRLIEKKGTFALVLP